MLTTNQTAPDFTLLGDDGNKHSLSKHLGETVILYFYPKDDTPGCTTEACDFRDNMERLKNLSVTVYGISKDSIGDHEKFSAKHGLNFTLLSDPTQEVHTAYGAIADGKTVRSTFIIDKSGKIAKVWYNVNVQNHINAVIKALDA
jgi:thioredoxin-dependent peroxiredoxin